MENNHCLPHFSITQRSQYYKIAKENVVYGGRWQAGSCPGGEGDWKGAPGVQVLVVELLVCNVVYSRVMML